VPVLMASAGLCRRGRGGRLGPGHRRRPGGREEIRPVEISPLISSGRSFSRPWGVRPASPGSLARGCHFCRVPAAEQPIRNLVGMTSPVTMPTPKDGSGC
jgi:hypothetical protein